MEETLNHQAEADLRGTPNSMGVRAYALILSVSASAPALAPTALVHTATDGGMLLYA